MTSQPWLRCVCSQSLIRRFRARSPSAGCSAFLRSDERRRPPCAAKRLPLLMRLFALFPRPQRNDTEADLGRGRAVGEEIASLGGGLASAAELLVQVAARTQVPASASEPRLDYGDGSCRANAPSRRTARTPAAVIPRTTSPILSATCAPVA